MQFTIRHWPDPVLSEKTKAVTEFTDELKEMVSNMWETLAFAKGVGLAANQVGIPLQIFIMDCRPRQAEAQPRVLINPEWVSQNGAFFSKEGCLSFPKLSVEIDRFAEVVIRGQNENGEWQVFELKGLEAICAQHEWDHLQGITFTDHLGALERQIAIEEYLEKNKGDA
jgi:peptide deformylase